MWPKEYNTIRKAIIECSFYYIYDYLVEEIGWKQRANMWDHRQMNYGDDVIRMMNHYVVDVGIEE